MNIHIVGGTYNELCFEPGWNETYGSGLRACRCLLDLDTDVSINYTTFLQESLEPFLKQYQELYSRFRYSFTPITKNVTFYYDHPLAEPRVHPRIDSVDFAKNKLEVDNNDVIQYGCIEGTAKVTANRVVYDPQSPDSPLLFSSTGSAAHQLAYVLNYSEAIALTGSEHIDDIFSFLFSKENCEAIVVKRDATGAIIQTRGGVRHKIPVYQTRNVWTIGSGDVFTATFAYFWFKGENAIDAANQASLHTACYANYGHFSFTDKSFPPLHLEHNASKQVYLAGPFFTFLQRWMIDQAYRALKDFDIKVFSPLHHVGRGNADEVYNKDIAGLEQSDVVFAIIDGTDTGTIYEIGYAIAKGIPVVAFVQNERKDDLLMIEGGGGSFYHDFTTAVYNTYWKLMSI